MNLEQVGTMVIGAVLSVLGGAATQLLGVWKDRVNHQRERERKDEDWQRLCEKEDIAFLRKVYQDAIRNLSLLGTAKPSDTRDLLPGTQAFEIYEGVQQSLAALCLHYQDRELLYLADRFTSMPYDMAEQVRSYLMKQAKHEPRLFSITAATKDKINDKPVGDVREFRYSIEPEYRKKRLIEDAKSIPATATLRCSLQALSKSQREKLFQLFHVVHFTIPSGVDLILPTIRADCVQVAEGRRWYAAIDPDTASTGEIMAMWETAYDNIVASAKQ